MPSIQIQSLAKFYNEHIYCQLLKRQKEKEVGKGPLKISSDYLEWIVSLGETNIVFPLNNIAFLLRKVCLFSKTVNPTN